MNKRGFIRLVEVLLSVVIIMGFLSFISDQTYTPTFDLRQNPTYKASDILDLLYSSGVLEAYLEEFDLKSLDSHVTYLLPVRTLHKIEVTMSTKATLTDTSSSDRIDEFGFTYNFPETVDKNSIFVASETELVDRNVLWEWYRIPFSLENNRTGNILSTNITITNVEIIVPSDKEVLNDSFSFFMNNEETILEVDNLIGNGAGWNNVTANITVNIPFLKAGSSAKGNLYYATNVSVFNNTQRKRITTLPNKQPQDYIKTLKLEREETKRADVLFSTRINASDSREFFLIYSLNTKRSNSYNSSINSINTTQITTVLSENNIKGGTFPLHTNLPLTNVYSSDVVVPINDEVARVKLYVWFIN